MKIQFLTNTYIRPSHTDLSLHPIGVALADTIIEVENRMYSGSTVDGINLWYKDMHGWYYWSGRIVRLEEEPIEENEEEEEMTNEEPSNEWQEEELGNSEIETGDIGSTVILPLPNSSGVPVEEKNWAINNLEVDTLFWEKGLLGQGVKVALLDTGIDPNYPDLQGRVIAFKDFCDDPEDDQQDRDGHGTNCAGLIGGTGQSLLLGIAPGAKLFIGRIMPYRGQGDFEKFINGLEWAMEQEVDIIYTSANWSERNLSIQEKDLLENTVKYAAELGTLIIAAAGDSNAETPEDHYPASFEKVLSVGAYNPNEERVDTSIKSYTLDVLAPGGQLEISVWGSEPDAEMQYSGFAASIVSGLMALVYHYLKENNRNMNIQQILELIRTTATNDVRSNNYRSVEYGWGLINPKGILSALEERR